MLKEIYKRLFTKESEHGTIIDRLEFIVTSECNLKCSYCYLVKHQDLYPKEIRGQERILTNLDKVLKVLAVNNMKVRQLDIFSGEIWHTSFGIEVFKRLLKACKENQTFKKIAVPSNCSFVLINEEKIQNIIDEFTSIGVELQFSCSTDGLYLDKHFRRYKNSEVVRAQEDYDKIFRFLEKNRYGLHPMVSADSTKYWKDNYDWFLDMCNNYRVGPHLMMLEVRDGPWEGENLKNYEEFIEHVFKTKLSRIYQGDVRKFIKDNMRWNKDLKENYKVSYHNTELRHKRGMTCAIQKTIYLRLGDLSFVPCHRLSYKQFLYGKLIVNDDYSFDIEDGNIEFAIKILSVCPDVGLYGCSKCDFNYFCGGPCLGANYEFCGEPFFVVDQRMCNMQKTRILTLARLYKEYGLIDLINRDAINSLNREDELITAREIERLLNKYGEI